MTPVAEYRAVRQLVSARAALRADCGSGTVLSIGIIAAVVLLTAMALPLAGALAQRHAITAAADAAALAAADVAAGVVPGYPCTVARRVAESNGAAMASCEVDGLVVTVAVAASVGPFAVTARATAGPPSH